MKAKRISVLSLSAVFTAVILLIALTAGVCLSSGATAYVGNDIAVSKTNVSANNITVETSSMTKYDENIASTAPLGAVAIASAEALKSFLDSTAVYGYLTADFTYDKEAMASNRTFAAGRTLNGNGHTLTLTSTASYATTQDFGLLVDVNDGTIENLKIVYSSSLTVGNASSYWAQNNVGILTGVNNGVIRNCDLFVSGSFTYNYNNTQIDNVANKDDVFVTAFGGFAGANSNLITNILLEYSGANITLYTYANYNSQIKLDSKAIFGGAVGTSLSVESECSNVIAISDSSTSVKLNASKTDGGGQTGLAYREAAAVQGNISTKVATTAGKVDNVIVYWRGSYSDLTNGTNIAQNAVVNCGPNSNVTVLDIGSGSDSDQCGCEGDKHAKSLANYVVLTGCTASIRLEDGKQIITVTPDSGKIMAKQQFYKKKGETDDNSKYEGVPSNGEEKVYLDEAKQSGYTLEIPAYQPCNSASGSESGNDYYWSLSLYAYEKVTLDFAKSDFVYTGTDYINEVFTCNGEAVSGNMLNLLNNGKTLSQMILPGEYNLTLGTLASNIAYVNDDKGQIAIAEDSSVYKVNIALAKITSLPTINDWSDSFNFDFTYENATENGANGYVYTVNGSLPKQVDGLNMSSNFDTPVNGRTYTVYLTLNGTQVTEPISFNVKVDANDPVISDVVFDRPLDSYYSKNAVTIRAYDAASGIAGVTLNNKAMTYDEQSDTYTASLVNGKNTIVVTDNVGRTATYECNAKIDLVKPVLSYKFYYYNNGVYTSYAPNKDVNSSVYIDLSGTRFGEAGGNIYYMKEGGEWQLYDGILVIDEPTKLRFKAESNTVDYDTDQIYVTELPTFLNFKANTTEIVVNNEDIVISGTDKVFDGTTTFKGNLSFANSVTFDTSTLSIVAEYADVNAGEVAINIKVVSSDDKYKIVSNLSGFKGNILKKEITVAINNAEKIVSQKLPVFTYTSDQIEGYEEQLVLTTDAGMYSVPGEYDIVIGQTEYKNYVVKTFTKGTLTVNKYVIDRMVYDFTTITGLDTNNAKGVVVGFKQFSGEYVDFIVSYEYSPVKDGVYEACDGMTKAGYYKVILSLPETMQGSYEIKSGLETFIVKVVDAAMFETEVEVEEGKEESLVHFENYVKDNTDADNTAIVKDYEFINNPEYVVVLAVFCLCIIAMFFAIGCGKVIIEKHKNNRNKKA